MSFATKASLMLAGSGVVLSNSDSANDECANIHCGILLSGRCPHSDKAFTSALVKGDQ